MTTNTAKAVAVDVMTRLSNNDIPGAAALIAEDCQNHAAIPEMQGRAGFVAISTKLRAAFPDFRYAIDDVITEGDRAVLRITATGTHTGKLAFARIPLEATNKVVRFQQIHIMRVANGQVVEHWNAVDSIAMLRQLELQIVPAAAATAATSSSAATRAASTTP